MRMIGHLDDTAKARTFGDYLLVEGIENEMERDKDGNFSVWIHAEEDVERSTGMLEDFRRNPADAKFQSSTRADRLKEEKRKEQESYEQRLKGRRHLFRPLTGYGIGPVTFMLIFISVIVHIIHQVSFGGDDKQMMQFFITGFSIEGNTVGWTSGLPEVRQGETWRLFTPIFLHFLIMGFPLHILFNMLWLRDLGSMIEARQNSWVLLALVICLAAASNFAQYFFSGPYFGGMSGVVYGLFGYVWIRGKLDPGSGLYLHSSTVTMMIVWFFVCFTGGMGPIGNAAHTAGLLMGIAWGAISSLRHR